MKNYFYNINKNYLQTFKTKILNRFKDELVKSDESFLKHIFTEITSLFKHLGGRTASKTDIPKAGDFPDSEQHNRLIESIHDDIDKIYTAQRIIEDDLNSLLKFNSNQRATSFEDVVATNQKITELFIKHKKDVSGEFIIETKFTSSDTLSSESTGVSIDETRKVLTLASSLSENKPIDTDNVNISFMGTKPSSPIYPNNDVFRVGSHWKIPGQPDAHFIDSKNPSINSNYRRMMIDDSDINTGVGWTEFEAVETRLIGHFQSQITREYTYNNGGSITSESFVPNIIVIRIPHKDIIALKNTVSLISNLNKDPELINLDVPYSLQGADNYIKQISIQNTVAVQEEEYKLVVPFILDTRITNEVGISFAAIQTEIPKVVWEKSYVFSNINGREVAYSLIEPADTEASEDGYYVCKFDTYIIPSRLELTLTYGGEGWHEIPFEMTHYVYTINNNYDLPYSEGVNVSLSLGRSYDIFVDSEPDKPHERARALSVLAGTKI